MVMRFQSPLVYMHSVLVSGHGQTVHIQTRRHKTRRLTGSLLFAHRMFYQILNKNEKYHTTTLKMEMDWSNR